MKTKVYILSTDFSKREIIARSKSEAKAIFKGLLKGLISSSDKLKVA